ncbi:hypothetical protein [Gordonia sp. (in: high G+C Gram-positive bacteria)]|uniref:hypothetical protein n=1 Tax=Gordonia sp. (in: high G+C Gram-positive bacteria) TaxID=84139 RepID=UPI00333E6064
MSGAEDDDHLPFAQNRAPAGVLVSAVTAVLLVGCGPNVEPTSASTLKSSPSTQAPQPHPSSARPSVLVPDTATEAADTATTTPPSEPTEANPVDPNEPSAAGTYCGDGYNQLAVWSFGPECATAMAVSAALGAKREAGDRGVTYVSAAGQRWVCGESGTGVPYLECSSNVGAVRLTS